MRRLKEILDEELARFGHDYLNIIETGTIRGRGEPAEVGDGYSTLIFAQRCADWGGHLDAIDLRTDTAKVVIEEAKLQTNVRFYSEHSISRLSKQLMHHGIDSYDVAFLDSDNDAQLILDEFLIAEQLVRPGGIVLIDDVHLDHQVTPEGQIRAKKGDLVWPYAKRKGYAIRVHERHGWADYRCGVLAIDIRE